AEDIPHRSPGRGHLWTQWGAAGNRSGGQFRPGGVDVVGDRPLRALFDSGQLSWNGRNYGFPNHDGVVRVSDAGGQRGIYSEEKNRLDGDPWSGARRSSGGDYRREDRQDARP